MMENKLRAPSHIGYIMDGNGRWANAHGMPRTYGHTKGASAIYNVVNESFNLGAKVVSLYAFSTENWSRPKEEVDKIFNLLEKYLRKYKNSLIKNEIRFIISGQIERLPDLLKQRCEECINETAHFTEKTLNIAISYGSRSELVRAVNILLKSGKTNITEKDISDNLYTAGLPDVDMIVRTSGEMRISNFMLWQSAYAELYFTDVYWPDMNKKEVRKAVEWYDGRHRRFGGLENTENTNA